MEFINSIDLQGIVGVCNTHKVADRLVTTFSLFTETALQGNGGSVTVDTTWFSVTAWDMKEAVNKGDWVRVKGRVQIKRYLDAEGTEKTFYQVLAATVTLKKKALQKQQ